MKIASKRIWITALLVILLSGCTQPSRQGSSSQTLAKTSVPVQAATASASVTVTATPPPTSTPTLTNTPTSTPSPSPTVTPTPEPVILIGAGDIGVCGSDFDEQTAAIVERFPDAAVFTAGDNGYSSGLMHEYTNCFGSSWGRFIDRIRPVPGNHDYVTPGAVNYYAYFGAAAGEAGKGYYSYELGEWHIVALNSLCGEVGGCGAGSPQEQWLRADLEASDKTCTLAYMHYPRWSSGLAGGRGTVSGLYRALVDYGVEVLVSGDDHDYERFSPQNGDGQADPNGVRQFVAGTGGALQRIFSTPQPNSEVRSTGVYGVLRFTLWPDRYDWEFIPVEGQTFSDSGSENCH